MPTISFRKRGKVWEYRFCITLADGKRKQIGHSGFQTKREAERAGNEALLKANGILPSISSAYMKFADYLDFWLENYCAVNLKSTTCEGYRKRIHNLINPVLGACPLVDLMPMMLQSFINKLFQEGYSRNSLISVKGILSGSLTYAVSPAGLIFSNPMATVRMPNGRAKAKKPSRKKIREAITAQQWERLMTRFPREHPSHLSLNLGYHLGLRLGEAFGLLWDDIDLESGKVSVRRQVQWDNEQKCWFLTEPKYDSFRTITIDPVLLELLKDERARQEKAKAYYGDRYQQVCANELLQLGASGKPVELVNVRENGTFIPPRTLQHTNRVAHKELDMPLFDFHTLRHTHATMLLEAGVNPLDIQERLGHTKLAMTWHYAHNTEAIRQQTTSILSKLYQPFVVK